MIYAGLYPREEISSHYCVDSIGRVLVIIKLKTPIAEMQISGPTAPVRRLIGFSLYIMQHLHNVRQVLGHIYLTILYS